MNAFPRSLVELETMFDSDAKCREYLEKLRWPDGFRCPRCGSVSAWMKANGLHQCRSCGLQTSVTAGTIFQDTKKPLTLWFRAMWHITSQKYGANALGVQRILQLGSYRTAWTWLHKLRRAMIRPGRERLSGVVQVDETYIGGEKPGKRGRGAEGKSLVLIVAQENGHHVGRIRLLGIPDASSKTLNESLRQLVDPKTRVKTDGWLGYNDLGKIGFRHTVVRVQAAVGDDLLPYCHRIASLLKRWLLGTYQGTASHQNLQYYLDEYTFRFNRRTSASSGKLFYRLVQQAVGILPVPSKSFTSK